MNSISVTLNRFIRNKNTVTIAGVVIILIILYFGYTSTINSAVTPVSVPVAATTIQPRTLITEEMVTTVDIAAKAVSDEVVRSTSDIIGKYSNVNSVIPKGSMFYSALLTTAQELPDSAFVKVEKDEVPYNFPVDMDSTYGNSIYPGNKIDIYMKAENLDGQIMVGKLIENVEVLAVKDSNGKHVFENTEEERVPAFLIFGVNDEINILLRKASYMDNFGVELFPVPHGGKVDTTGQTQVSTEFLKEFINANTVVIPEEQKNEAEEQKNETDKKEDNATEENNESGNLENIFGNR